jgi:Raf kinase inhibitor-like YbhB/YbcL family protein
MRKIFKIIFFLVLSLLLLAGVFIWFYARPPAEPINQTINLTNMKITSPEFQNNKDIPAKYTCDGEGVNPPLAFAEVPADARGLALVLEDPDAPGRTFIHWLLWNIPTAVDHISEDSLPVDAARGKNSTEGVGYVGPCPPSGTHHYIFKLYALDDTLDLPAGSDEKALEKAMQGHIIDTAELVGLYKRAQK